MNVTDEAAAVNHSCESSSAVIHAVIYAAEPREGSSVRPCVDVELPRASERTGQSIAARVARARSNRPNLFRHVRVSRDRFETHNTTPQESLVFMSLASVVAAETNHSAVQMRRDATRQVRAAVDAARLRTRTRATCARCE